MNRLCLVLSACASAPPSGPVFNTATAPLTRAQRFVLDGLGSELFGPDPVHVRANDRGEVVTCVTHPEGDGAFTTRCSILLPTEPLAILGGGLPVMLPDAARAIDRGEPAPLGPLADDLRRVRAHVLPTSRAFVRICDAAGRLSCDVLGATATVAINGFVSLSFAGEIQSQVGLCTHDPLRPSVHATVLVDAPSRHVLVMATTAGCPIAGFVMRVP